MQTSYERPAAAAATPSRRLAVLLDLYERNFRLLQRLIPALDLPPQKAISHSLADPPLHLTVTERDRSTLTCKLTYEFVDDEGVRRQPDLWVRIYRDAGVAEALNQPNRPPWEAEGEGDPWAERFLDEQWRRNLTLGKWLEYLIDNGHGFGRNDANVSAAA